MSSGSGGSYESSSKGSYSSSSDSNSMDKHYLSEVPSFPLKDFQDMQHRMASRAKASLSKKSPSPP